MRLLKRYFLALFVAFIGYAGISAYFAWQLTSPARRIVGEVPPELPLTTQVVSFLSRDGLKLSGWFIPCANATKAVVLLHGNGSSRRQMIPAPGSSTKPATPRCSMTRAVTASAKAIRFPPVGSRQPICSGPLISCARKI